MKVMWTLTTDVPVHCLGLFETKEYAENFRENNRLGNNYVPTPLIMEKE